MVDATGSEISSNPTESRSIDHSRKYRAGIVRRLQKLRHTTDKKKTSGPHLTLSSSSQIEPDVAYSRETETRDAQPTVASKSSQSPMKPPVSFRQKQKIVQMIRSKSHQGITNKTSASPSQQRLSSVPSPNLKSIARPTTGPVSNPIINQGEGIDDMMCSNRSLLEETTREGHQEEAPPSNHSVPNSNTTFKQRDVYTSRTTFHVRLSIGYMTGLKIDKIAKRAKQPTNNRITVGFVKLASSGKYTALSQPLLTNVDEKAKTTKILWSNQRGGEEISKSKSRRTLHFSLQLEKEDSPMDMRDDNDDSLCSQASFEPEVVQLLIGLKCGDERLPLGIAEFVVNGRETVEQKMDLEVLPAPGLPSGPKAKRGIFGKKQRSSFTNGDMTYRLAPNATLRVKADIRTGYTGQDGAEIWDSDESSYVTKWTFDAGAKFSPQNGPSSSYGLNKGRDKRIRSNMPFKQKRQIVDKIDNSMHTSLCVSPNNGRLIAHEVPVQYVFMDSSNEMVSVMSSVPNNGFCKSWSCAPLFCGDELGLPKSRYRGLLTGSFSFESSQMMENNETVHFNDELQTYDTSAESSWNFAKKLLSGNKYRRRASNRLEETDGDADDEIVSLEVPVETYSDLKKSALETIERYGNIVGVDTEDLFEGMDESIDTTSMDQ